MTIKLARDIMERHGMKYARFTRVDGVTWHGRQICYCIYNHTVDAFTDIIKGVTQ